MWGRERRMRHAFLSGLRSPFGIQGVGMSWCTVGDPRRFLTDALMRKHLHGDLYVGGAGRSFTKTITVDIDAHNGEEDVLERTQKVIGAVPDATPLVTTTPRNGTHVTWLLSEPSWSANARAFMVDQIGKTDVCVQPGTAEVFPHGWKILRMPLGRDCVMLDPDSLEPIGDRRACIDTLDRALEHDTLDRLEIPDRYAPTTVQSKTGTTRDQRHFNRRAVSPFMREVDNLLHLGLPGPGTRNHSLLTLCWFYHVVLGHESDMAVLDLRGWIDWGNNGLSRDYNRNPRDVYAHIDRIVADFDWGKVNGIYRPSSVGLEEALGFLHDISLNDRARNLFARMIVRALNQGERRLRLPIRHQYSGDGR